MSIPACPSKMNIPCLVMSPPNFIDTSIQNNIWMKGEEIDKPLFYEQWYNLYRELASRSMVYLIPPLAGLQDQTYVNSFVTLPNTNKAILSNFLTKGRQGESKLAAQFLTDLYFDTYHCPYSFEGYPDLKYIKEVDEQSVFIGGYGIRTAEVSLDWISETFGIKIIKFNMTNQYLYHMDFNVFVLNNDNIILATDDIDQTTLRELEKIVSIDAVDDAIAMRGITSCIKVGNTVFNATDFGIYNRSYKDDWEEKDKNEILESICRKLNLKVKFIHNTEAIKSGGALACFTTPLNYIRS